MIALPDPRRAALIARVEIRRRRRALADNPLQAVALAIAGLFLLVFVGAAGLAALFAGRAVRDGGLDAVGAARTAAAGGWFVVTAVVLFRTLTKGATPDALDGLLTTVPHRDLVGGLALAEFACLLAYIGAPTLVVAVAFGVGAGSAASVATVALALAATGLLAGFAAGLAAKNLAVRSAFVARRRGLLWAVAFLAYVGVFATQSQGTVFAPVVGALADSPLGWFADLALVAATPDANAVRAALAVSLTAAAVPLSLAAAVSLAGTLWYADGVRPESAAADVERSGAPTRSAVGVFDRLADRPTAAVARKSWLRARRAPIKLVFVAYPLFFVVQPLFEAVQTRAVPATLPPFLVLYGAWATGAAFTLNPLGDEGAALPSTLTTGVDGRSFLRGLALCGVPTTAVLAGVLGALSPLSAATAVALTAAAPIACAGAAGLATGVGVAFPRFEAARISRSREAVVPSVTAFAVYSALLLATALPGLVAGVPAFAAFAGEITGIAPAVVRLGGASAALALVGGLGWVSYRLAARRFDGFAM
ncbi:hypothetical protein [Halegenticoccus soli]|uniref:hypothetical protein n=1 Tax=Halegenticoccus soli TaxID=1985678 RepID=UPI000C6CB3F1|nr:hypothetical protein [Halegenticoccus soli]